MLIIKVQYVKCIKIIIWIIIVVITLNNKIFIQDNQCLIDCIRIREKRIWLRINKILIITINKII